jgi:Na+/melibiose symporter-like transporter
MNLLYAVAPFAGALGAALIIHRYPFSEVRGAATTAQLQERRRILARNRLGKAS